MKWRAKHHSGLDPGLVGERAFEHPAVREYWRWLIEDYAPAYSVALVTPCSNVKPYTRSPASRKLRGLLRRMGLWDEEANRPRGLAWLYFSDLLILVPYEKAEEYPACCYEVPPDTVLSNDKLVGLVADKLAEAMEALARRGLREAVVFLPRKHLVLWEKARLRAADWPREVRVRYTLFSFRGVGEALSSLLQSRG